MLQGLEPPVQLELRVYKALLVLLGLQEFKVSLDHRVQQELRALRDLRV